MSGHRDARAVAAHVEQLLTELERTAEPTVVGRVEDLVRGLMEFYGAGLARVVGLLSDTDEGTRLLARLAEDRAVASLLVLHDLHPASTAERVAAALEKVRPYLGSHAGGVELLGVDGEVVRLRLEGNCDGCPSSTTTVELAIEQAIDELAPEITRVQVDGVVAAPRPGATGPGGRPLLPLEPLAAPAPQPSGQVVNWVDVTGATLPVPGTVRAARLGGQDTVLCGVGGNLYAYRDQCPACRARLSDGRLEGGLLCCEGCPQRYDVCRAGAGDGTHLEPLPLLDDAGTVRVAVPTLVAT